MVQYTKTRPVFDSYKAAGIAENIWAQHEAELADYRAAKATILFTLRLIWTSTSTSRPRA